MPSLAPLLIQIIGEDKYTKAFKKSVKTVEQIGQKITSVGKTMTVGLTTPIMGAGLASVKLAKDMNAAMANVGTLIPGEAAKLENFKDQVLSLSNATGKASTVIADGLYETISAFGSAQDPISKLDTATRMSIAGQSSVKEAIQLVSAVTKGYGDTSDEAAKKVSDLSFLTVNLGQTTFPELAASMGKVVPLASTLKIKQDELFGSMATLTGVTGNAAEVSTQLKAVFGAFIKPSTDMTKAAKKLGYESSIAMIKQLGLEQSLLALQKQTGGSEMKMAKLISREEGLNAALALLGPQAKSFNEKISAMGSASGATEKAFKEQTDGINKTGFGYDRLVESVKNLAVRIGDRLMPVLGKLIDKVTPYIDKLLSASDSTLEWGIKIAGLAAAIGPALIVVGKLVGAASSVMSLVGGAGGIGAALTALTGPVGIAVAAIAGLTAAVIYFWDELQPIRDALSGEFRIVLNELASTFTSTDSSLSKLGNTMKGAVGFISGLISPVVKLSAKLLLFPMRMIIKWVQIGIGVFRIIASVVNIAGAAFGVAKQYVSELWASFTEGTAVGKFLASVFESIGSAITVVVDGIQEAWVSVKSFVGGISGVLDTVGIDLGKMSKFEAIKAPEVNFGSTENTTSLRQQVLQSIETGKQESTFNINIEGLPTGASAKVVTAKGGTAKVKTKGRVMEGLV